MKYVLSALLEKRVGTQFEFGGYTFKKAETDAERDRVYELIYDVYAKERFIDPAESPQGQFRDEFDAHSILLMAQDRFGRLIGTTRLVLPSEVGYPIESLFDFEPPAAPRRQLGE